METTFLNIFKKRNAIKAGKYAALFALACLASSAYAQAAGGGTAWGGAALCMIANNTKATVGIAAVLGILIGGVMALFKKGDHLLDTVVSVCIVCGVAFLAVTIINQMGFNVTCAGL